MRHHFNSVVRLTAIAAALVVAGCSGSSGSSSRAPAPAATVTPTAEVAATTTTKAATTTTEAATTTTEAATTTTEAATTTSGLPGILASYPKPLPGDFPDGVYEVDITDADLAAVNDTQVAEDHGHYVWTFAQGVWKYEQTADNPLQNPTATGTYSSVGDQVSFYGGTDDPGQDFIWAANADGSLQLTYQASTQRGWSGALGSHPLIPVG